MLKVEISKRSAKFLSKLPPKHGRQLGMKIQELRSNPNPPDSKKLKGYESLRRTDMGEYRIVYFAENDTLKVVLVGKRNDDEIYKQLRRL
jgi:mRNA interferase RelE/StbE